MTNSTPNELELMHYERLNTGTTKTNNAELEKNGFIMLEDLWDPEELYHPVPTQRGQLNYWGTVEQFNQTEENPDVPGSLSRYNHPQYRLIFAAVRKKIEEITQRKVYKTYFYDQYFFPDQKVLKHINRNASELMVEMMISTNLKEDWPLHIKTPDTYTDKSKSAVLVPGEERVIVLKPGTAVLYKGCERPVWRDAMPGAKQNKKIFGKAEEVYYHQIHLSYVLADGERSHCADDMSN